MKTERIGITWQLSDGMGWGVFGLNLALELIANGPCRPLLLIPPAILDFKEDLKRTLVPLIEEQAILLAHIEKVAGQVTLKKAACIFAFGNEFIGAPINQMVRGHANIGFIFYENTHFDTAARERAAFLDRILVGSSWNRDYLQAIGFDDVGYVSQGVDTSRFAPGPRSHIDDPRFRVFSGGKLEFRKGQDIVIAAFQRFHERHPDSVLVSTWFNPWPDQALDMERSPHLSVAPEVVKGECVLTTAWALANGIPEDAFIDLGLIPNAAMPDILRGVDVAIFANRCEGGTNLVAMEAMACGVPCIMSANSGHLDIIGNGNCYPLLDQSQGLDENGPADVWRESSVDEIVECMEKAYTDRDDAARRGRLGAKFITGLSWHVQIGKLVDAFSDLL